jgi:hypothetical protein
MGCSKRGADRDYDSPNGFGAIVGSMSGLVLNYSTCNRKCKKCDSTIDSPDHDCRKHYYGSAAKGMESFVAKKLIVDSEILKSPGRSGDDDNSSIAECCAASKHPIIKQSDTNHATK